MEGQPLISIIIPVYNVQDYIEKCVNSVINQTYINLEIILVDDGSTDSSGEICDEYELLDKRIKVIHKVNGGLSSARNEGLKIFKGKYIMFVDSDDILDVNGLSTLFYYLVKYEADIVIGGVKRFNDENKLCINDEIDCNISCYNSIDGMKDMFINGCASWARLYKRSVHENIYFPLNEINEDEAIVLRLYEQCNKIVQISKTVYYYRLRSESITTSTFSIKQFDWYYHCKSNLEYVKEKYPKLVEYAEKRYYCCIMWLLINMTINTKNYKKDIKKFRLELRKNSKVKESNSNFSKKDKLLWNLLSNFYFFYLMICKIRRFL